MRYFEDNRYDDLPASELGERLDCFFMSLIGAFELLDDELHQVVVAANGYVIISQIEAFIGKMPESAASNALDLVRALVSRDDDAANREMMHLAAEVVNHVSK